MLRIGWHQLQVNVSGHLQLVKRSFKGIRLILSNGLNQKQQMIRKRQVISLMVGIFDVKNTFKLFYYLAILSMMRMARAIKIMIIGFMLGHALADPCTGLTDY